LGAGVELGFNVAATTAGSWRVDADFVVGSWQHCAIVYDGTSDSADPVFYRNGVSQTLDGDSNPSGTRGNDGTLNLIVGNNQSPFNRCFDGRFAYVHVYRRLLSAEEIGQLMRLSQSVQNGLIAYSPFWGGASEPDMSGKGHTGTVTGALVSTNEPPTLSGFGLSQRLGGGY
jgi:hypothetical protein